MHQIISRIDQYRYAFNPAVERTMPNRLTVKYQLFKILWEQQKGAVGTLTLSIPDLLQQCFFNKLYLSSVNKTLIK